MDDLISVIIITYNSEKTILKTLESIRRQTYDYIEIIVSDDCSSDNTIKKAVSWKKQNNYKRMKIISTNKNTGITANVNRGIIASTGKAIKIIAGDDYMAENAVEVFYRYYETNRLNTIFQSRVNTVDENDLPTKQIDKHLDNSYKMLTNLRPEEQFHNLLLTNYVLAPAIGLIDRRIFEKYGMFDDRFPMIEDYPFYLKLSYRGIHYTLIDEKLVFYRISSNSVSKTKKSKTYDRYMMSLVKFNLLVKIRLLLKEKCFKNAIIIALWSIKKAMVSGIYHRLPFYKY